jgi:hypothetical protein
MREPSGDYVANTMLRFDGYNDPDACADPEEEAEFCATEYAATEYRHNPCSDLCDENARHRMPCQDASKSNAERGCDAGKQAYCDCGGFGESKGKAQGHWFRAMPVIHKESDKCSIACPGIKIKDTADFLANEYYLCSTSDY